MSKESFAEVLAKKIIKELETGKAPWQKPWQTELPFNALTGNQYKGANRLMLMSMDFKDPRYMTFNQAKEAGYRIKKGARGIALQSYMFQKEVILKDKQGNIIKDDQGKDKKALINLNKPIINRFVVFNAEQIDGIPELAISNKEWHHERAEAILKNSNATITHQYGDNAYYSPATDEIVLPEKTQFDSLEKYYGTALHELGHWTGHSSRLDRFHVEASFGSEEYAKEELRAEISSMLLSQELGISHDTQRHNSYIASWIRILTDSPHELVKACNDAEKISQFILDFDRVIDHTTEAEKDTFDLCMD